MDGKIPWTPEGRLRYDAAVAAGLAADPAVKAAAEAHAKHPLPDAVASFAELRAWKNGFA